MEFVPVLNELFWFWTIELVLFIIESTIVLVAKDEERWWPNDWLLVPIEYEVVVLLFTVLEIISFEVLFFSLKLEFFLMDTLLARILVLELKFDASLANWCGFAILILYPKF